MPPLRAPSLPRSALACALPDRRFVLGAVLVIGLGCAGNSGGTHANGGHDAGSASGGATASGGAAGTGATMGNGGATGSGGISASGGTAGAGATTGNGGAPGAAGSGATTASGGNGNAGGHGGGASGHGGSTSAGGAGGVGGAGGRGGRGGVPGTGGCGCICAGTCVGTGGTGNGGNGAGGAGGAGGAVNPLPPLHVTTAQPYPANQIALLGLIVDVDSQDRAVVVGVRTAGQNEDPGPAITWIPRTGSPTKMEFANAVTPEAMTLDPSDNVWMTGQLYRPVTFGGPTADTVDNGYYLAKLGPTGTALITKAVAATDLTHIRSMTADSAGNVYVVGSRRNVNMNLARVFVTKYSPSGSQVFDHEYASTDSQAEATDVAVAPDGTVLITGFYVGQITFGTTTLTGKSSVYDGFVAWLDAASGAPTRAQSFGGTAYDFANSIEVTSAGTIRIGGQLSASSTVGGMTVSASQTGSPFVAELSATGTANWVRVISGNGIVFQGDTNTAGRTFEVGRIDGSTQDSFVEAVGADGVLMQPFRLNTTANGALWAAADRHGGVWVAGEFSGTVNFGTGPITGATAPLTTNYLLHLEP